jgi:hypothetical protein
MFGAICRRFTSGFAQYGAVLGIGNLRFRGHFAREGVPIRDFFLAAVVFLEIPGNFACLRQRNPATIAAENRCNIRLCRI